MNTLLILFSGLVATVSAGTLVFLGLREIVTIWIRHRMRIEWLHAAAESDEESLASMLALQRVWDAPRLAKRPQLFSAGMTGLFLCFIGGACSHAGVAMRYGATAVGLHVGGNLALGFGVFLVVAAFLARFLGRPSIPRDA